MDEEEDDWSVILTPPYSSGESEDFDSGEYLDKSHDGKIKHIKHLWHKL
jgi:hypothetical protein